MRPDVREGPKKKDFCECRYASSCRLFVRQCLFWVVCGSWLGAIGFSCLRFCVGCFLGFAVVAHPLLRFVVVNNSLSRLVIWLASVPRRRLASLLHIMLVAP